MLKTLLTMLLALFLLIGATFAEQYVVQENFKNFNAVIEQTQAKLHSSSPSTQDAEGLEDFWLETKHDLHAWIPHTEIKEIDLWVSECCAYTKLGMYDEASTKLEVLKTLANQVPHNFSLLIENLF